MIILTINNWRKTAKEKVARDWDFQVRNFGMAYFTGKKKVWWEAKVGIENLLWTLPFKATFKKAYHMYPSVFPWSGVRCIKLWQRLQLTLLFRSLFLCNQAIKHSLVLRSSLKRRGASVVRKKGGIFWEENFRAKWCAQVCVASICLPWGNHPFSWKLFDKRFLILVGCQHLSRLQGFLSSI